MKILIRNLSRDTTEAAIRAMFEPYGAVQSCTLVIDEKTGLSKGFGFIEMPKQGEAKAAIKTLNGTKVDNNVLRVKKAVLKKDQSTSSPKVGDNNVSEKVSLDHVTLETILKQLVEKYGWENLAQRIKINCFKDHPSISSSLKFLRKTEWARKKVEALYLGCDNSMSKDQHGKLKPKPKPKSDNRTQSSVDSVATKKNVWGTPIDENE